MAAGIAEANKVKADIKKNGYEFKELEPTPDCKTFTCANQNLKQVSACNTVKILNLSTDNVTDMSILKEGHSTV